MSDFAFMTPVCNMGGDENEARPVNAVNILRCPSCRKFEAVLLLLADLRARGYTGSVTLHMRDGVPASVGRRCDAED